MTGPQPPRSLSFAACIGLFLLGCGHTTSANEFPLTHRVDVEGTITDTLGNAAPGVAVTANPGPPFSAATAVTTATGYYSLSMLARFADTLAIPDSLHTSLAFRPAQGVFRDSLLLLVGIAAPVVAIGDSSATLVVDTIVQLP